VNGGLLVTSGTITGGNSNAAGATTPIGHVASVQFGTAGGILQVKSGAVFTGAISGFRAGDTVDITNIGGGQIGNYFNQASDTLTTPLDGTLKFAGFTNTAFTFTADASGNGTNITIAACFRRGTRILAERGEVAIETLRIGDEIATLGGGSQRIRWIGRRSYTRQFATGNRDVLPVLIRAGALADGVPSRDLWVSPDHALYIDGVLIPSRALINGESIVQESSVAEVSYYHLEFDEHAVITAEGALSESYVDDESRGQFDNAAEYTDLYPHAVRTAARFCAPRAEDGELLERVRRHLMVRSDAMTSGAPVIGSAYDLREMTSRD